MWREYIAFMSECTYKVLLKVQQLKFQVSIFTAA